MVVNTCKLNSKDQSKRITSQELACDIYPARACPPTSPKKQVPLLTTQISLQFQRKVPQCLYLKTAGCYLQVPGMEEMEKGAPCPNSPNRTGTQKDRVLQPSPAGLWLHERSRVANPSGWHGVTAHSRHGSNATWSSTEPQGARETASQGQGPHHSHDKGHRRRRR